MNVPAFFLIKQYNQMQLPVPPAEFKVQVDNSNQSLDIYNLGEINLPGKDKLATITIESMFPAQDYPFCQVKTNGMDPWLYVDSINNIYRKPNEPIRLIITESKVNDLFLIESFQYGIINQTKDVWYTITLKQYRQINISSTAGGLTSTTGNNTRVESSSNSDTSQQRTYTVVDGDCLWNIAKKYYGDGSKYTEIYNANSDKISNENLIYPGQVFVIPYI